MGLREGVGNFNADGKLDVVVANPADNGDSIECVELGDRSWRRPLQGRITENVVLCRLYGDVNTSLVSFDDGASRRQAEPSAVALRHAPKTEAAVNRINSHPIMEHAYEHSPRAFCISG